jgi:hypothetical protein
LDFSLTFSLGWSCPGGLREYSGRRWKFRGGFTIPPYRLNSLESWESKYCHAPYHIGADEWVALMPNGLLELGDQAGNLFGCDLVPEGQHLRLEKHGIARDSAVHV